MLAFCNFLKILVHVDFLLFFRMRLFFLCLFLFDFIDWIRRVLFIFRSQHLRELSWISISRKFKRGEYLLFLFVFFKFEFSSYWWFFSSFFLGFEHIKNWKGFFLLYYFTFLMLKSFLIFFLLFFNFSFFAFFFLFFCWYYFFFILIWLYLLDLFFYFFYFWHFLLSLLASSSRLHHLEFMLHVGDVHLCFEFEGLKFF